MPLPVGTGDVFGRIVTRRDVENACVSFLQTWVPTYVAAMEQQAGLPSASVPLPPDVYLSYRGGLDADTWEQAWAPCYIVVVNPIGVERVGGEGLYIAQFEITVHLNFVMTSQAQSLGPPSEGPTHLRSIEEDSARQYADILGMAACAAMVQHTGLGTWPDGTSVAIKSVLNSFPRAYFPFPDERRIVRSSFVMHTWIGDVVREQDGPALPNAPTPYTLPGDWPIASQIEIQTVTYPTGQTAGTGIPQQPVGNSVSLVSGAYPDGAFPNQIFPGEGSASILVKD